MSNLPSLHSINIGYNCFGGSYVAYGAYWSGGAPSLSLNGNIANLKRRIDLPKLQSVIMGREAFQNAKTLEMTNLTSLHSIVIGSGCFGGYDPGYYMSKWVGGAISFNMIGMNE